LNGRRKKRGRGENDIEKGEGDGEEKRLHSTFRGRRRKGGHLLKII